MGELELAIEDCTEALSIKSDYIKVLNRRCQAFESLKKYDDALVGNIKYINFFCQVCFISIYALDKQMHSG